MYWPDTQTGVDVEPTRKPVASAVRKFFTEGGLGQAPTVPGGDWFNQVTNELLNVLSAAGIDPSKTDDDQLLQAINALSIVGLTLEGVLEETPAWDDVPAYKGGGPGGEMNEQAQALLARFSYLSSATGLDKIGFQQSGVGAAVRNALLKTQEVLSPEDYGAVGNGVEDDTVALNKWITAIKDLKRPGRCRNTTYRFKQANGGINIVGHRGSVIDFNGAIFKAVDGDPVVSLNGGMSFSDNQDCHFLDFVCDGNRAARSPGPEIISHNVAIWENNARLTFTRCRSINSVVDGWYLRGAPATLATYPTDITLIDCDGINSFRNNMSPVGTVRLKVIRGNYNDANGIAPQAGIDIEPNIEDVHGNVSLEIIDVNTSNNAGYGTSLVGPFSATDVKIRGLSGNGNGGGLLLLDAVNGADIIDTRTSGMSLLTRGVVDVAANANNVRIDGVKVENITAVFSGSNSVVYLHKVAKKISVKNVEAKSCSVPTMIVDSPNAVIRGIETLDCTANASAINMLAAANNCVVSGLSSRRTTGGAFECASTNNTISDLYAEDSASAVASLRFWAANNKIRGVSVHQTSGTPPGAAMRVDAVQAEISGLIATGGYTDANMITGAADKFVGTKVANVSPDCFAKSFTYDPPSLASAGTVTTTIPLAKANLGDACVVHPPYDLQGIIATASVSATGAIRLTLFNPTAGAIDFASGTWVISLKKS